MNGFHLTNTKYALRALQERRLKIARINELNDPFELLGVTLKEKAHRSKFREFKYQTAATHGFLCFSRSWKNPVLWSHYADRHQGVALEFRIHDDDISDVSYTPDRVPIDVDKALLRGTFTEDDLDILMTTKFEHWRYEDEVRVACLLADSTVEGDLAFEPFSDRMRPVGLVKGARCSLTNDRIAANLPSGTELRVTQARLAFDSFEVVRQKLHKIEVVRSTAQP